ADALSFTLSLGGLPFLIDPGTYRYHGGGRWREYFRGTSAHNTVRVDGVDQSEQGGDFLWLRKALAGCTTADFSDALETLAGWHEGYLRLADPVLHRRRLTLEKRTRSLAIEDRLEMSGEHEVEIFFHCAAECAVEPAESGFAIRRGPWTLLVRLPPRRDATVRLYRGSTQPLSGWVSRHYDQCEPAPTIVWRARLTGPTRLCTRLMCRSDYPPRFVGQPVGW
ncbi:MAG TPA: heparinase II/III-family protein, partial [Steroidobacteraceae bacterium]|nr:heparinase II/III-family protein [Steroidobacteraceae bacterium]